MVEAAHSIMRHFHARETNGTLTPIGPGPCHRRDQGPRYDHEDDKEGNYFWINDMTPTIVMHPVNPALNGKNVGDSRIRMELPFNEMRVESRRRLRALHGPKPGHEEPQQKLSYVRACHGVGWSAAVFISMTSMIFSWAT